MRNAKHPPKIFFICAAISVLFVFFAPTASAETTVYDGLLEKSGAAELYTALDTDTQQLMSQLGVNSVDDTAEADSIFAVLSSLIREKAAQPLKALAALTAIIILCRLAQCFGGSSVSDTIAFASVAACSVIMVSPLLTLINRTVRCVEAASVFILAAVPVYSALIIAGGSTTAATSYGFLSLAAGSAIPVISSSLVLPMLRILLLLAPLSSFSSLKLSKLSGSLYGLVKWLLVLSVTVFSGVLSVQTLLNSQVDAAGNKAIKLIASSAVPIVGGAFGDAVAAIQSSVQIVKSGAGAFGMLAALCVFAPTAAEAALWSLVCRAAQLAAALFDHTSITAFLEACTTATKTILAVISSVCAVSLVVSAMVLLVKSQA